MAKFADGKEVAKAIYYSITDEFDVSQFDTDDWQRHVDMAITILDESDMIDAMDVRNLIDWAFEDFVVWELLDTAPVRAIACAIEAENELGSWE